MHPMLENKPFFLKASAERVCLLLHGLGGGPYEMQPLAESLYAQGLSVLAVAYPGHDKPARRMPASTWPEWYGHIEATYRKLAGAFASISVVGFSTGCPLALHLAAHWPVAKLVLISPFVSVRHRWFYLLPPEAYLYSVGRLLPQVPRRRLPVRDRAMREAAEQAAYYRTFNLCAVRSALALVGTVKAELSLVRSPLLILQSRRDSVVAPSGAEYIYRRVRSRVRQLHWFDKSDHILPLDLERKEVYERVGRFLL
ncbi:gll2009 [Gloeobacter violaceus PCC 7421]|uniref:Gll2009 protein n=2 Tax=Gloeobacter violaceus TaxID=33072 RepID=Q7NJ23_GLOVI|nr:gll2009 [Gloeobacter violaceus PCC 7421]